jgi:hypothetical protein
MTSVSAFAVSVFPTPVGPRNKKLPRGLPSSASHALALRIALATADIAFCCQITCFVR